LVAAKLKPHLRRDLGVERQASGLSLGRMEKPGEPVRIQLLVLRF
jgi:hypothetical protein